MNVVFDTGMYISLFESDDSIIKYFAIKSTDVVIMPIFVYVELLSGLSKEREQVRRLELDRLIRAMDIKLLLPIQQTTKKYLELMSYLKRTHPLSPNKQHKTIGHHDNWIASITFEFKATLYTRDPDFENFDGNFFDLVYIPRIYSSSKK